MGCTADFPLEDDRIESHKLSKKWNLKINNLFTRVKDENGDLVYFMEDKTLRLAIWNDEKSKSEIYKEHEEITFNRSQKHSKTLETFEFSDSKVSRIGYMVEEADQGKVYKAIYGFSIIDNQIIQMCLYFDNPKDKSWAIETWKSIKLNE